jgi:transposase
MRKHYLVQLSEQERAELEAFLRRGKAAARKQTRARILLLADDGRIDRDIAQVLHCGHSTVERIRKRYAQEGLNAAIEERFRPGGRPKLDAEQEAILVALACSDPPPGRAHWTMQLLADQLVELEVVDALSDESVRRTLKKRLETVAERAVVHW